MLVTRFDPFKEFGELRRGFNYLNAVMDDIEKQKSDKEFDFVPTVNTREGDDAYYVDVDLPGISKEDINIDVDENVLTVSGERKVKEEHKEDNYYKVESAYGKFERSFTLPDDADADKIEAASKEGVLEISIPKVPQVDKAPKKIEIK
jgi:HSP20 family protein